MRRTAVFQSIAAISFTALSVAIGACASSEPADLNGIGQDHSATIPSASNDSSKLPPSNPSNDAPLDAGTSTPKDSGTSTPKDSGTSTPTDSGTSTGNDCDPNNFLYILELAATSNPAPCPCNAGECCFMGNACLPQ